MHVSLDSHTRLDARGIWHIRSCSMQVAYESGFVSSCAMSVAYGILEHPQWMPRPKRERCAS